MIKASQSINHSLRGRGALPIEELLYRPSIYIVDGKLYTMSCQPQEPSGAAGGDIAEVDIECRESRNILIRRYFQPDKGT